jgi:succinate-semialdehyde dehydrogenase/glutarate-semialdehyde dehydrogenase
MQMSHVHSLLAGVRTSSEKVFSVVNPYSKETIAKVSITSGEQIALAVSEAKKEVQNLLPAYEIHSILMAAAELIRRRSDDFIKTLVQETGFSVSDARGEISRGLDTLVTSAEEAKRLRGDTVPMNANPAQDHRLALTIRVPVGVVCAITPFNSPFNAVMHKLGPALAGGNAVLLKPSEYAPLTPSLICDALLEAGLTPARISLVNGGAEVGRALLAHQGIDFYSFTGSTAVGRIVQAGAGLRRTQLELGSIACTVVCGDAELHKAIPKIARASFRKAGQVCTSIQRLYVERSIVSLVSEALVQAAKEFKTGDPADSHTSLGPMISLQDTKRAHEWIEEAVQLGAKVECGGFIHEDILAATLLSDVRPGMKVLEQEIFAPVVSIIPFDGLDQAIDAINEMEFGLAVGIFTQNIRDALTAARKIRVGSVYINDTSSSRTDSMPYGGVKASGFGREGPAYCIREMTEERVIVFGD